MAMVLFADLSNIDHLLLTPLLRRTSHTTHATIQTSTLSLLIPTTKIECGGVEEMDNEGTEGVLAKFY